MSFRVTLKTCSETPWLHSSVYQRQVEKNAVSRRSSYDQNPAIRALRDLILDTVAEHGLEVKTALIGGIGGSPDEICLLQKFFPGIETIHAVDWYGPNLEELQPRLKRLSLAGKLRDIILHHDDLRDPQTVTERADLVFANQLFPLYLGDGGDGRSPYSLLADLHALLNRGGILISPDYRLVNADTASFAGLQTIGPGMYMKADAIQL